MWLNLNRSQIKAELIAANRDVAKVENRLGRLSIRFAARVRALVMQAFQSGSIVDIAPDIVNMLRDDLRDAMMYTHLLGSANSTTSQRLLASGTISASVFTQVLRKLAKQRKTDIVKLSAQYGIESLRVLIGASRRIENELRGTVSQLIAEGANLRDAKKIISAKFDTLGITPKSNYQIQTIFRTQSQIAHSAGRWEAAQSPEIDDILWGYQYVTVGDDRVRENHANLDGVTLPKNDPFWLRFWPPNGYNCRCQVIEMFDEQESVQPPADATPDEGFGYNPGLIFA